MLDNRYEFKLELTPFLTEFSIKTVFATVKNTRANAPMELAHQVIYNMNFTKDIHNKLFNYIDPWGETLASVSWVIISSYYCTIGATPVQTVYVRNMLFILMSIFD